MGVLALAWLLVSSQFCAKKVLGCILVCSGRLEFWVKYYTLKHMQLVYQLLELVATLTMEFMRFLGWKVWSFKAFTTSPSESQWRISEL